MAEVMGFVLARVGGAMRVRMSATCRLILLALRLDMISEVHHLRDRTLTRAAGTPEGMLLMHLMIAA